MTFIFVTLLSFITILILILLGNGFLPKALHLAAYSEDSYHKARLNQSYHQQAGLPFPDFLCRTDIKYSLSTSVRCCGTEIRRIFLFTTAFIIVSSQHDLSLWNLLVSLYFHIRHRKFLDEQK